MVTEAAILVALLRLIDRIPMPNSAKRRGRPKTCSDRLFLKALVIMVVRHLTKVHSLLAVLEEPEMQPLRDLLVEHGRYPTHRTFERRLRAMPESLPAQIACPGRHLLMLIEPFQDCGLLRLSAAQFWLPMAACGTRSIERLGWYLTPPSILRLVGPSRAGMAGSMGGDADTAGVPAWSVGAAD